MCAIAASTTAGDVLALRAGMGIHAKPIIRALRGDEAQVFAAGTLMLEAEADPLAPAALEPLSDTEARLTITEGRYHQVRRTFSASAKNTS